MSEDVFKNLPPNVPVPTDVIPSLATSKSSVRYGTWLHHPQDTSIMIHNLFVHDDVSFSL